MLWLRLPVYAALLILLFSSFSTVHARTLETQTIPDDLKTWVPWVLHGHERQTDCPFLYNNVNTTQCSWPSTLSLALTQKGGVSTQNWQVYIDSWLPLPGSTKHWPQDVTVNGKAAAVTLRKGKPMIWVAPGLHTVQASLAWDSLPESLAIPPATGIVSLSVGGESVEFPDMENGKLWIRQRASANAAQEERLSLHVYRQVIDDIPLRVSTYLQLDVSGKQREINIGKPILDGFIPLSLQSRLPARLEEDGSLRLQVRAGRWHIYLVARHPEQVDALTMPSMHSAHWPKNEVWVFRSKNENRLVEVKGIPTIDSRQTQLPDTWRNLPAYQLKPGDTMQFKVIRRGDPEPAPDQLTLQRKLWLHFDGSGYTVQDAIGGSKTSGWRLNAQPLLQLGRVLVDGKPQFITTLDNQQQGIEVRRGGLNVQAEGQIHDNISTLPAIGWNHDFKQVSADLQLPPGWRLLSVSGVDNVPGSWLQRWTLLDLFLVLIITISVARLWAWPWGLLALVTVVLLWHEPLAPKFIWLNLLAAIALLRVLPEGKIKKVVNWYRLLSLLGLVMIAVPFMVDEVRNGLYPQLERPWAPAMPTTSVTNMTPSSVALEKEMVMDQQEAPPVYSSSVRKKLKALPYKQDNTRVSGGMVQQRQNLLLEEIDPNANVQTGPGLPKWSWKSIPLRWNGPVDKSQQVDLVLLSPAMNFILNLLRVVLLFGLGALMFGVRFKPGSGFSIPSVTLPLLAGLILLPWLMVMPMDNARAEMPTPELLNELKTRLLKPPECLPGCAQIPRLRMTLQPQYMELLLEVHALEDVAIPLPGDKAHWLAQEVMVNGKKAKGLFLSERGQLWLDVAKGIYQVTLRGAIPNHNSLQLPFPLLPRYVEQDVQGWTVDGLHENGLVDTQLQLTRIRGNDDKTSASAMEAGTLPAFVRIERTLRLGIEWQIETRVIRESPLGSAVIIEVPLVTGESVTSEGMRVKDGKVLINMGANERYSRWSSRLEKNKVLTLTAPMTSAWTEIWRLDISPIWHIEASGINVIHHTDPNGRWFPEYRPWPGESIKLAITRPLGVEGKTRTIDYSQLVYKPGQRSMETVLSFTLRASQGGQHTVSLPQDAKLQSVEIDHVAQPIRQKANEVTFPVHPGQQNISMTWRTTTELPIMLRTVPVDLGIKNVNHTVNIKPGRDRWVLFTGGPKLGPAVLFWGVLIVIILIAIGLGRVNMLPLKTWHWVLLGIGLSQSSMETVVIVVGWLFALAFRERMKKDVSKFKFNFTQVTLAILTVLALVNLFVAIQQGLLGYPDMQVSGNQSNAYDLKWYQDRSEALLPTVWVVSVPLLAYRILMLLWSLWLAFALLGWLKWGWQVFSSQGMWRSIEFKRGWKSKGKSRIEKETPTKVDEESEKNSE